MAAYYNEVDPFAAEWLRTLIAAGHIAPGEVDERDIRDVRPDELAGFAQCHFFAGIGGWSYALRLAGWPDDRPVWTGSCPCQPFSAAGAGGGFADERHLWPHFHWLIAQRRPSVVFGEQVASKAGLGWLDLVSADLEGTGYAFGAADLCAASVGIPLEETPEWQGFLAWLRGTVDACPDPVLAADLRDFAEWAGREIIVGAPHIRRRLFWLAESAEPRRGAQSLGDDRTNWWPTPKLRRLRDVGELGDAGGERGGRHAGAVSCPQGEGASERGGTGRLADEPIHAGAVGIVGVTDSGGSPTRREAAAPMGHRGSALATGGAGFWSDAEWLPCSDGKARPVEPGTFPLAHGVSARVGRLRAYGNAIVPQLAAEFIRACDGRRRVAA